MKELLKRIGLSDNGEVIDDVYVIRFDDYDKFTDIYNKLENGDFMDKISPESFLNESECNVRYENDDYILFLIGIFDDDDYSVNLVEKEN